MNAPDQTLPAWWRLQRADDCVIAAAIHDGTLLRPEVAASMALDAATRLREEDPFTGQAVSGVPTHVVPLRSRFEVDLNRAEGDAVYLRPEQSWGLQVWRTPPSRDLVETSLRMHRAFYAMLAQVLDDVVATHGRFLLLDVHSYNHRREGPDGPPMAAADAPEINLGTFSMPRERWAFLVDPLTDAMRRFDFLGRRLDVRENVAFQGRGQLARFVHERYPGTGCSLAIEFKKFYMDEWTGQPDHAALPAMRAFITHAADTGRALLHG
ncbi:MAG TPA: N-formylglutamate amidohydrolase [Xanthomonadaceae bacterium]|nr:N-formylglutamate amidohydrolase [Xanthomonadaceae bacterium]